MKVDPKLKFQYKISAFRCQIESSKSDCDAEIKRLNDFDLMQEQYRKKQFLESFEHIKLN